MLQSLRNRRNRKGFTLAELLIVVAIIAVLVAIAVPLFVGQVKKAQDTTFEANKRSARGTVVAAILGKGLAFEDGDSYTVPVNKTTGEIGTITKDKNKAEKETATYAEWQETGNIVIIIKATDLDITVGA